MDLLSFSQSIIPYITNPAHLIFVFWIIVFIVIIISLILIYHWRKYSENILGGITILTIYSIGVFVLLGNIYRTLINFITV